MVEETRNNRKLGHGTAGSIAISENPISQLNKRAYDDLKQLRRDLGLLYADSVRIAQSYRDMRRLKQNAAGIAPIVLPCANEEAAQRAQHKIWDAIDALAKLFATEQALSWEEF